MFAEKSDAEISAILNRSKVAIQNRRKNMLGIHFRKHWKADEEERLRQLLTETDKPLTEIAELMDRTVKSIERRKERLKIHRIPFKLEKHNPAHVAEVIKFKMAGWTHEAIAEAFGVKTSSQISHVLITNGYHRFCPVVGEKTLVRWTEGERDVLRECLKKEMGLQAIQEHLPNRSISSIKGQLKRIKETPDEPAVPKPIEPIASVERRLGTRYLELQKGVSEALRESPALSDWQIAERYNCLPEFVRRERAFYKLQLRERNE